MPIIHIIKDTIIKSYSLTGKPTYFPEVAHTKLLSNIEDNHLITSSFLPTGKELSLTKNHKKIVPKL